MTTGSLATGSGRPTGSRGWTAFVVIGLAGWVGSTVWFAARNDSPSDGTAARRAIVIGGAIFFGFMFAGAAWSIRRAKHRSGSALYGRLAIAPLAADSIRRATSGLYRIGYVYVAFGAVVTALGLAATAVGDEQRSGQVLRVAVGLVMVWVIFAGYALKRSFAASDSVMRPLGLALTGTPSYHYSVLADRGWMTGAMTFAGERHGRRVSITQQPKRSVTVVADVAGQPKSPTSPAQMAQLTGESIANWRRVTVAVEDDAVVVERRRNGAGGWFLHDLLLAESVAGSAADSAE